MDHGHTTFVAVARLGGLHRAGCEGPGRPGADPCQARLAVSVLACGLGILAGTGATALETPGALIRCPDWQDPARIVANIAPQAPRPPAGAAAAARGVVAASAAKACTEHTIQPGDTLGKLARQYLGTAARHPEIAALNPAVAADPKKLRPGQVLRIQCETEPATGPANVAQAAPTTAKPGFWARLFGIGRTADGETRASETIETTSIAPEVVRTPPEIPVWRAEKGEYLIDVLERWGKAAGYEIVIEDRGDWRFRVPFRVEGPLRLALREVVKGFGLGPSAPLLVVYGNRVVRVGAAR